MGYKTAKITRESIAGVLYESHMRLGDLREAIKDLPDDACVGLGIVDQPYVLPTFCSVIADPYDNFLWLLLDCSKKKDLDTINAEREAQNA